MELFPATAKNAWSSVSILDPFPELSKLTDEHVIIYLLLNHYVLLRNIKRLKHWYVPLLCGIFAFSKKEQ